MLVAQNSLGPVCPVPLTVRGNAYGDQGLMNQYSFGLMAVDCALVPTLTDDVDEVIAVLGPKEELARTGVRALRVASMAWVAAISRRAERLPHRTSRTSAWLWRASVSRTVEDESRASPTHSERCS